MGFPSWLCSNNTKNMLLKIVHPGGHVEYHDRPLLAAEIMHRNPKCCVAYPHVFQQPWAIVPPETSLMLGKKFYVVPMRTIRRLQRLSKYCPPQVQQNGTNKSGELDKANGGVVNTFLCLVNKNIPTCGKEAAEKDREAGQKCSVKGLVKRMRSKASCDSKGRSSSSMGVSETRQLNRKRTREFKMKRGPPTRYQAFEYWQPSLHSISEEEC